jgi:hypothetical protein
MTRFFAAMLLGCITACAGETAPPKPVPAKPEVLFLGPIHRNAMLYDLIWSYLVESGVYIELDDKGQVPEKLPADLSGYKVIIADRDLPLMQDAAQKARLEEFEKKGGGVIYHQRPKEINWNSNDPELYQVHDAVVKTYGVKTQNPAFLERNAARPDKEVILACADESIAYAKTEGNAWYLIGNDVAFMHFEGFLKTADLYERDDIRQFVLKNLAEIAEKKGSEHLPVFGGHLLVEFQKPGFEPYAKKAFNQIGSVPGLKRQAMDWTTKNPYITCEGLSGLNDPVLLAGLYNKPAYFQPAVDCMKAGHDAIFDPKTGLWAHGGKRGGEHTPPWARGHGWMLQGLVALIEYMPKDHPDYKTLVKYLEETAEGLRKHQDPETGLWRNLIDDPSSRVEASGTGMIVRGYCHAWRAGVCQTPEVKEMLTKAWKGLKAHTVRGRTYSFLWGMGASNDRKAYAAKPSSGTSYVVPLAGPEFVKTFGPLVK